MLKEQNAEQIRHLNSVTAQIQNKSDRLMNYFLGGYFIIGLLLAFFYDTWLVALGVGGLSLIAYYSSKYILPESTLYQYVLSTVLGIFMAQFIYQMHGMFEMHFIAFISSAMLIAYQNWKLQIPLTLVVVIHHAVFGYLQFIGFDKIYFTQLEYMSLQTFIIHALLAAAVFIICGLWAYRFRKQTIIHLGQSFEIGRLQIAEAQKTELMKVNSALDKFVYSVSHDLRAPLTSMLGVINISESITEQEPVREQLGMVKESIKKLDGFILDILDYSRNSRMEVKKEEINFKEILKDISNNLKFMGDNNRRVDIKYNVSNGVLFLSDKRRLGVVLNNLISNSIRYQNPGADIPYVDINVCVSESEVYIKIKDNGIGISKENQPKIFDMFYRVSENSVGSGLGLYIVKETIDKLNGNINVESEEGQGTVFNISIPNSKN
jgi:signal transduction histidine kinase